MTSSSDRKKFNDECLRAINERRARHQADQLKINSELSKLAQQWAEICLQRNSMSHSGYRYKDSPVGENVFMKWTSDGKLTPASLAVDSWYSEIKDYNFETGRGSHTGHFTQLVWRGSREVGIGRAVSDDGKTCFVVTNYFPPGNVAGNYQENVIKVGSSAPKPGASTDPSKPRQSVMAKLFNGNGSNNSKSSTVTHHVKSQPLPPSNPTPGVRVVQYNPSSSGQLHPECHVTSWRVEGGGVKNGQRIQVGEVSNGLRIEGGGVSNGLIDRTVTARRQELRYETSNLTPSGGQTTLTPNRVHLTLTPSGGQTTLTPSRVHPTLTPSGCQTTLTSSGGQTTWSYRSETVQDSSNNNNVRTYRVEQSTRTNVLTTHQHQQQQIITRRW